MSLLLALLGGTPPDDLIVGEFAEALEALLNEETEESFHTDPIALEAIAQDVIAFVLAEIEEIEPGDEIELSYTVSFQPDDELTVPGTLADAEEAEEEPDNAFFAYPDDALYIADLTITFTLEAEEEEETAESFWFGTIDEALAPSIEYLPAFQDLDDHEDGERERLAFEEDQGGWFETGLLEDAPLFVPGTDYWLIRTRRRMRR